MSPKNIVYFGSPDFSATILESLIQNIKCNVVAIVTSPDKPAGRKQINTPSPVAIAASRYDLPVFRPEKLDEANLAHLKLLKPDLFLVVSYGKIIPPNWLSTPTLGTINLHFSLLPKYRGALCVSEAIRNQDRETGVTLMVMDEGLDTGPIIVQEKIAIDINDNTETLTNKLTQAGIKLLKEYLPRLTTPSAPPPSGGGGWVGVPQNDAKATVTPTTKTRTRQNAFIPWSEIQPCLSNGQSAVSNEQCLRLHALIRSLNPDPGAWTRVPVFSSQNTESSNIEIKIIKTKLDTKYLILDTIQLPGKNPVSWDSFLSGHIVT